MMKKLVKGDIYVVFGERGDRDRTKRPKMTTIATNYAKWTIITTSHVFFEDPQQILNDLSTGIPNTNFEVIPDRRQAIAKGISLLKSQDCLLILGKGNEDYLHYGDHVVHFDDVEEAQKIIDEKLAAGD
jgi:UDP-N-acetylmuramoyl-L-alanyl-D-glutamate--2,6-diaminopimelate ligase